MLWAGSPPSPVTAVARLVISRQETHGAMPESAAPIALVLHRTSCPAQHRPGATTVLGTLLFWGHHRLEDTNVLACQHSGVTIIVGSPAF